MEIEKHYEKQLAKEIRRIAEMESNKEVATQFWKTLDQIKPKSCIVKSGMCSGSDIDFTLIFENGGNENPYDLFIKNIENIDMKYGFIFGLNPDVFHFNPQYSISDNTHSFVTFKLMKNG